MTKIHVSRTTTKSADDLWAVIADFPNIANWTEGVTESHSTTSTTEGVGAQRHCDLSSGGTLEETIQAWDEGRSVTISIDEARKVPIKHAVSTFTIAGGPDGRTISMETDFTPKGGPFGLVLGPIMKPLFTKGNRGILDEWVDAA